MPRLERPPRLRAWRWLRRLLGFESHDPLALLSGDDPCFIGSGDPAALVNFFFPDAPPRAPVAFQQIVSLDRPPRACRIVRETAGGQSVPNVQNRLNHIQIGRASCRERV